MLKKATVEIRNTIKMITIEDSTGKILAKIYSMIDSDSFVTMYKIAIWNGRYYEGQGKYFVNPNDAVRSGFDLISKIILDRS